MLRSVRLSLVCLFIHPSVRLFAHTCVLHRSDYQSVRWPISELARQIVGHSVHETVSETFRLLFHLYLHPMVHMPDLPSVLMYVCLAALLPAVLLAHLFLCSLA